MECNKCCWCGTDLTDVEWHTCTGEESGVIRCNKLDDEAFCNELAVRYSRGMKEYL